MNQSKCPVPREQQPTNEFIELSKSKIFSWPKTTQSLVLILTKFNIRTSDFFVFGQEKILDFDNSINSFVGCCSLGTGHLDSFIIDNYGNIRLSPLLQNDSRS